MASRTSELCDDLTEDVGRSDETKGNGHLEWGGREGDRREGEGEGEREGGRREGGRGGERERVSEGGR